jgi:hypothetical protein
MLFIETSVFSRCVKELLNDDSYRGLQEMLINYPDMGATITGTAGLRKLRWKVSNQGKRGGLRLIYYWATQKNHIYMLYPYHKSEQNDLTTDQKKTLMQIVERWSHEQS